MKVTLIGLGCGTEDTMTHQAEQALEKADLILGASRLLDSLPEQYQGRRCPCVTAQEIISLLEQSVCCFACVVYSGDTGFYSGARLLLPLLHDQQFEVEVLPGISSIQAFAARLGQPWQDWRLVSAHGVACDAVGEVCQGKPVCFLTDPKSGSVSSLCRQLTQAGLGALEVTVGEQLTCPEERIVSGSADELACQTFAPLSVLLVQPAPKTEKRVPGLPDRAFVRGAVPMTKQEVRCAVLAKLAVLPTDICWDIGAGTGSVSIELAQQSKSVWAVEQNPDAIRLIQANRTRFSAWNLHIVEGAAPAVLEQLPMPDVVFIGGSGGALREILTFVAQVNPKARICVSAIALETLETACATLEELGYEAEVCQIAVSRARKAGRLHLMMAQNPVFLVTGVVE